MVSNQYDTTTTSTGRYPSRHHHRHNINGNRLTRRMSLDDLENRPGVYDTISSNDNHRFNKNTKSSTNGSALTSLLCYKRLADNNDNDDDNEENQLLLSTTRTNNNNNNNNNKDTCSISTVRKSNVTNKEKLNLASLSTKNLRHILERCCIVSESPSTSSSTVPYHDREIVEDNTACYNDANTNANTTNNEKAKNDEMLKVYNTILASIQRISKTSSTIDETYQKSTLSSFSLYDTMSCRKRKEQNDYTYHVGDTKLIKNVRFHDTTNDVLTPNKYAHDNPLQIDRTNHTPLLRILKDTSSRYNMNTSTTNGSTGSSSDSTNASNSNSKNTIPTITNRATATTGTIGIGNTDTIVGYILEQQQQLLEKLEKQLLIEQIQQKILRDKLKVQQQKQQQQQEQQQEQQQSQRDQIEQLPQQNQQNNQEVQQSLWERVTELEQRIENKLIQQQQQQQQQQQKEQDTALLHTNNIIDTLHKFKMTQVDKQQQKSIQQQQQRHISRPLSGKADTSNNIATTGSKQQQQKQYHFDLLLSSHHKSLTSELSPDNDTDDYYSYDDDSSNHHSDTNSVSSSTSSENAVVDDTDDEGNNFCYSPVPVPVPVSEPTTTSRKVVLEKEFTTNIGQEMIIVDSSIDNYYNESKKNMTARTYSDNYRTTATSKYDPYGNDTNSINSTTATTSINKFNTNFRVIEPPIIPYNGFSCTIPSPIIYCHKSKQLRKQQQKLDDDALMIRQQQSQDQIVIINKTNVNKWKSKKYSTTDEIDNHPTSTTTYSDWPFTNVTNSKMRTGSNNQLNHHQTKKIKNDYLYSFENYNKNLNRNIRETKQSI